MRLGFVLFFSLGGLLGCLLLLPSSLFAQTAGDANMEPRFWAGIITYRPTNDGDNTIYLVPKTETVDGVATLRYEQQTTPPLRIRRVMVDSPASEAGFQTGDTILAFNDTKISTHVDLVAAIQGNRDQRATVRIVRGQQELSLELRPIARPADYAIRVQRDRESEAAELQRAPSPIDRSSTGPEVVAVPANLSGLLALAAQNKSQPESSTESPPTTVDQFQLPADANFNRSTQLLIEKLEQFSIEWTELLERQKQTLRDFQGLL